MRLRCLPCAVALVGGVCNHGANCDAAYVYLNNAASNANWRIGASHSYQSWSNNLMHCIFRATWQKLNRRRAVLVGQKCRESAVGDKKEPDEDI